MKKAIFLILGLFILSIGLAWAEEEGVELTIYNQNFGVIKDKRFLDLKEGANEIKFQDVAATIEPETVHFKSLSFPDKCTIKEQNYEYDLVSPAKLLTKYVDKKVKIVMLDGTIYEGTLSSFDGQNLIIVNEKDDMLNMVNRSEHIRDITFPELPEGLITKPTLIWDIACEKAARHLSEVSYMADGVNWAADYVAVLNKDDKKMDLNGWVTIDNKSGATYKNAKLKLIAGDVRRQPKVVAQGAMGKMGVFYDESIAPSFEEKPFFEYHMYTLQYPSTVKDNQTKQISLLTAEEVPVNKILIFESRSESYSDQMEKAKIMIETINSKENKLGMPLPKGKVRVYKKDQDDSLQFVGEDNIDHTPKDEKIRLYLGDAFDVVGQRKKTNFKESGGLLLGGSAEESYEISLRNHKEEDTEVTVVEHLYRYSNWKITASSHPFSKKDAQSIEFKVKVPKAGEEVKVNYTVKYWW